MQAKERRQYKSKKNSITLEQLLSKEELSDLELYVLELSKKREPSWEVLVIHQRVDENTARGSLAKLQTSLFTELTKKLRENEGALLEKCDTLYAALKIALDIRLINNFEFTRGIRINSATNMAKHRLEPDQKNIKDKKKKERLEMSDSGSEDLNGSQHSDDSSNSSNDAKQREPIEDLNQGAKKQNQKNNRFFQPHDQQKHQQSSDEDSSEKDIFAQNMKDRKKGGPAKNLFENLKNERMALHHELIEAILRGNLPEVVNLVKKGASLIGPSFKERYQQIIDWATKTSELEDDKKREAFSTDSRNPAARKINRSPVQKLNYNKVICPLTAAALSLNEEMFNYVQRELGKECNWYMVSCDLLIKTTLLDYANANIPTLKNFEMLYNYRYASHQNKVSDEVVKAPNPTDDITLLILLENLINRGRIRLDAFEAVYSAFNANCMDKIDQRPPTATYEWLAKWYEKYARESWVPVYNQAIYGDPKTSWANLLKTLMNAQKLFDSVGAKHSNQNWDNVNKKDALIPFPEQHDKAVRNILEKKSELKKVVLKELSVCQQSYCAIMYNDKSPGAEIKIIIDKMMPAIEKTANLKLLKHGSFKGEFHEKNNFKLTYTARPDYPIIIQQGRSTKTTTVQSPTPEQLCKDIQDALKLLCNVLYMRSSNLEVIVSAILTLNTNSTTISLTGDPAILEYLVFSLQKANIVTSSFREERKKDESKEEESRQDPCILI